MKHPILSTLAIASLPFLVVVVALLSGTRATNGRTDAVGYSASDAAHAVGLVSYAPAAGGLLCLARGVANTETCYSRCEHRGTTFTFNSGICGLASRCECPPDDLALVEQPAVIADAADHPSQIVPLR